PAWVGPRDLVLPGGRDPGKTSITQAFPAVAASQLGTHVEHLLYGARASIDRRGGAPHWSHGFRLAAEAERFDKSVDWLGLRDAATPAFQFTRYGFEGEAGFSFWRDPRTVRLAFKAVNNSIGRSRGGLLLIPDRARL